MNNEHDELQQLLESGQSRSGKSRYDGAENPACVPTKAECPPAIVPEMRQWECEPNNTFRASGLTREILPSGVYRITVDGYGGLHFVQVSVLTDKLVDLKDSASEEIIQGVRTFWESQDKFNERGILYKRGVLLWGPPGSGKTVTIQRLIQELVTDNGLVLLCEKPSIVIASLVQLRRVEPDRRLIVVEEDIEEILREYGEHDLLALLDGENQIANVVHVATTNYPGELGARIINRPSRFDEVRKIGMPNIVARTAYLLATASECDVTRWAKETEGMSIAHLRELVVAVFCLGRKYEETLARLKKMAIRPKDRDEGFGANTESFGLSAGMAASQVTNGHI
jgi:ATPase family protein associated with various cellular activities (AAA)